MLIGTDETLSQAVTGWLAEFEKALAASDEESLEALFRPDAHWRDLLAFTWQVNTVSGARKIVDGLKQHGAGTGAAGFEIDPRRTPPRRVTRAGTSVIEAIFRFETANMRGQGVLRPTTWPASASGSMSRMRPAGSSSISSAAEAITSTSAART